MAKSLSSLLILLAVWHLAEPQTENTKDIITAEDFGEIIKFTCNEGVQWKNELGHNISDLTLNYEDDKSGVYTCERNKNSEINIFVKFRTCDNCIELDTGTVLGLVCGDLVATFLIGVAVYCIASQPRGRVYTSSHSKASDRQNLIPNQPNDTYMPLTQGHSSEYSRLERRANKK